MVIGSLFAGIGGFDLAARWMGWRTAWFSEVDPYASAVLRKHWPGVPNHGDITLINGKDVEPIDMLVGGFPCQDISVAGKGAGITGSRSGLWSHYARLIDEVRPRWVVAENVPALRSRGLDDVLRSLAQVGYDAEWHCIPAAYVGARHRRDRIWIVAHPSRELLYRRRDTGQSRGAEPANSGETQADPNSERQLQPQGSVPDERRWLGDSGEDVAHPDSERLEGIKSSRDTEGREGSLVGQAGLCDGASHGQGQWAVEPDVGRVANGVPSRVHRLRCLGNAIVPQVAHLIFQAIQRHEDSQ